MKNCPTPDCDYLYDSNKINPLQFKCQQCRNNYCLNCNDKPHLGYSCDQYRNRFDELSL